MKRVHKFEDQYQQKTWFRYLYTGVMVTLSAFTSAAALQLCIRPAGFLSSGFTGLAILIQMLLEQQGIHVNMGLINVLLNIPAALLCIRSISIKFTIFSSLQVILLSLFLSCFHFSPLFTDPILNATVGGAVYGIGIVLALKGNASTGGTDFIAQYVSNRTGKGIWNYVFIYNCCLLCIFGMHFGWEAAGYSILTQFVSTKVIESLYHRYERSTLQITTKKPQELVKAYTAKYRHGITVLQGMGGYSNEKYYVLNTVASSYEVRDIAEQLLAVDPHAIINIYKSEDFYGGFYRRPID